MNYHLKSREKKPIDIFIYKGIFLFLFLLFINILFGTNIKKITYEIEKQFLLTRNFGNNFSIFSYFKFKNDLIKTEYDLRREIETLRLKNIELSNIELKYKEITSNFKDENLNVARIVLKPPFSPYDSLKIDKGEKGGVAVGDLVLADDSVLLGQVSFVSDYFSLVSLFSTSKKEIKSYSMRNNNPLTIIGSGGGNFYSLVPKDFEIKEGDIFIESNSFKPISIVSFIDNSSKGSFDKVYFITPISVKDIMFVNILKNKTI